MEVKQKEYAVIGAIFGAIIGLMAGFASLNLIKKSQREQMLYPALGICIIGFAVVGYSKGKALGRDIDIETKLGIDKVQNNMFQQGRTWIAVTEWTGKDNQTYQLITGQTKDKILISQLNKEMIMNHEINSGSQVNVIKYHQIARNYIFKQQKEKVR